MDHAHASGQRAARRRRSTVQPAAVPSDAASRRPISNGHSDPDEPCFAATGVASTIDGAPDALVVDRVGTRAEIAPLVDRAEAGFERADVVAESAVVVCPPATCCDVTREDARAARRVLRRRRVVGARHRFRRRLGRRRRGPTDLGRTE